jgi:uncharacterized protein (TIGR03382 family)
VCDGAAACALYPSGTSCGGPSCATGALAQSRCTGSGQCLRSTTDCAPYTCASDLACRTRCSADADCVEGAHCVEGACLPVERALRAGCGCTPSGGSSGGGLLIALAVLVRRRIMRPASTR